ncbi:Proto-oncogene tyrosine-protein kinase receptor Ret [Stylophora pistillata]|uniref:Proto-oncogene tyrosine-protein kinase receptor Ret n=1 Tax=Stylophora pistillata TaxID=50429 RepID=A0A2B4SY14_STYPI|nr:Proto-oncogene tyrosine-protein kinase receptor Ret [Stylophora pistillata]
MTKTPPVGTPKRVVEKRKTGEILVEEPSSHWYWTTFQESKTGAGWNRPSTRSPVYTVCDFSNKNEEPKNWLRSDYINIKDATRIDLEVAYTLRNYPSANACPFYRTNFSIHSYHSSYKLDPNPDPTKVKFQKETVITPKTLPASNELTTDTFYGSIVRKAKGIYLAILDQGACLTIRKFVVRYRFCSETFASLVKFPRTVAPVNDLNSTKQEGECADPNSHQRNNRRSFGVCLSNGEWNITDNSSCLCNYGYELTSEFSDSLACKECQRGFYKDSVGNTKCLPCPVNSASNSDRTGCKCKEGYYRSSNVADCEVIRINVINITMVIISESCIDGEFDQSSLLTKLEEAVKEGFLGRFAGFKSVLLKSGIGCGSINVDLTLIFNSKIKEHDVITVLLNASEDGRLGYFSLSAINGERSHVDLEIGKTKGGTTPPGGATGIIDSPVVGLIAALAVAAGLVVFFVWKSRKRNSRNSNGKRERTNGKTTEEIELADTGLEIAEPPRNQQYMGLNERGPSSTMLDARQANCPQPAQPVNEYTSLYSSPCCWEIPTEHVNIEKVIGEGAFAQVARATVKSLQERPMETLVAVKMLKGPLMVLIEYVPYGDLLGYLRKSRGLNDTYFIDPDKKPQTSLTSEQLMKFAWQVADGMSYLSSIPIIHRDLAARNVLVGEGETCKVTDFGLARDVQKDNIYQMKSKGRVPLKWTSIEALLYGKYSTKSDVWSYGVLLYEIFTIGGSPYPRMDHGIKIAKLLEEGYRMPKPQHVDDKLYEIMTNCWKDDPNLRPSFQNLRNELKKMEKQHKGLINLKKYNDLLYVNVDDIAKQVVYLTENHPYIEVKEKVNTIKPFLDNTFKLKRKDLKDRQHTSSSLANGSRSSSYGTTLPHLKDTSLKYSSPSLSDELEEEFEEEYIL